MQMGSAASSKCSNILLTTLRHGSRPVPVVFFVGSALFHL